jgi:hypothetical protein
MEPVGLIVFIISHYIFLLTWFPIGLVNVVMTLLAEFESVPAVIAKLCAQNLLNREKFH